MLALAVFCVLIAVWGLSHLFFHSRQIGEPFVISHRGAAALAPENTLAGIREALSHGAEFIEIDVHRSADGVLIVMHDSTVDRTTDGKGQISDHTIDELGSLDAGSGFSPKFAGEPVPTLDDVLELVVQTDAHLVIEAKQPKRYPGIEQDLVDALRRYQFEDRTVVVSFDHDWLDRLYGMAPALAQGNLYVWMTSARGSPAARMMDVYWLSVILDPTLVKRAHGRGYEVAVWTVDTAWCMRLLLLLGVDAITTNRPDLWNTVQ